MNGLNFYRPEFLWALLFLAAVLLIHLLRRPRTQTLDFSTLRFFRDSAVKASRMRRLRRLLLLLARLSAVTMLVVLFSRPFNKHDRLSLLRDPHLTMFTWIDQTPSMEYTENNVSLLSQARAITDSLRSRLLPTARCYWYDDAQSGFAPCDPAKPPLIRLRHGPAGLERMLRAWNESRGGCSLPLLVLLSDYQKSSSGCLDTLLQRVSGTVLCVVLTPDAPWNYSLCNALYHEAGNASNVSAVLAAQGKKLDSGEITVAMSAIRAGKKRVSAPVNDTSHVAIEVTEAPGTAGGSVTLTAKDPLTFDNTAFFTSRNRSAQRVIVVGDPDRNFPVAAAFSAAGENRWNPVTVKNSTAVNFDELDSADIVVINGLSRLSQPLQTFFAKRSPAKKAVIFACNADDEGDAALLSKINRSPKPLRLVKPAVPASIVLPDTLSEIWRGFPALRTVEAAIYRYTENLQGTVLLRLDNGTPLITLVQEDENRLWILIATPLGVTDANNLCETGFYVPCIDRIAHYAANRNTGGLDLWRAGFERRNPLYGSGKGASVLTEDGKFLERWQSQPDVLIKQPGLYKVMPDGEQTYWIAVNPDSSESRLTYKPPAVPEVLNNNILILNKKQLAGVLKGRGTFLSYLPWLILALFLLAEVLLWEKRQKTSEIYPQS